MGKKSDGQKVFRVLTKAMTREERKMLIWFLKGEQRADNHQRKFPRTTSVIHVGSTKNLRSL